MIGHFVLVNPSKPEVKQFRRLNSDGWTVGAVKSAKKSCDLRCIRVHLRPYRPQIYRPNLPLSSISSNPPESLESIAEKPSKFCSVQHHRTNTQRDQSPALSFQVLRSGELLATQFGSTFKTEAFDFFNMYRITHICNRFPHYCRRQRSAEQPHVKQQTHN